MRIRLLQTITLLFILCSLVFSQAIVVHNGNNSILHAGLVADYTFAEGTNQLVFNRTSTPAYPSPVNQFGALSEQFAQGNSLWTLGAGVTVTDFFATDRHGNQEATRLVMTGGSSQALFFTITTTAVPYTVSFYVKSNTGVSQAVSLGVTGSPSVDKTVTTSWTRVESTFTPSAAANTIGILNDAAHDATDILISEAQLEIGGSSTAYVIPVINQQLGLQPIVDAHDPTWGTGALDYASTLYTRGISPAPLSFSSITLYAVFKKTAADTAVGLEPIFTSERTNYSIAMETRDMFNGISATFETGPSFAFGGLTHNLHARDVFPADGNYHVFCGTYDGTTMRLYWDGSQVATLTASITTQSVHRFFTGFFEGLATTYFPGSIALTDLYSVAHTTAQVRTNTNAIFQVVGRRGISITTPPKFIGFEGDSITAGTGLTNSQRWSWLIDSALSPTIPAWNDAVGGSTVAITAARMPAFNAAAINPGTHTNVLTLWLGANDLISTVPTPATFVADFKALCISAKAAGWNKIVVIPIMNRGDIPAFDARRLTANALVAADPDFTNGVAADIIATLDPVMMASGAPSDPTLFQTDLVHPTAFACLTYLSVNIQTAIVAVY